MTITCFICHETFDESPTFGQDSRRMRCPDCQRNYEHARDNDL